MAYAGQTRDMEPQNDKLDRLYATRKKSGQVNKYFQQTCHDDIQSTRFKKPLETLQVHISLNLITIFLFLGLARKQSQPGKRKSYVGSFEFGGRNNKS